MLDARLFFYNWEARKVYWCFVNFIADRPIVILLSQTYAHGIKTGFNTYSLYSFVFFISNQSARKAIYIG